MNFDFMRRLISASEDFGGDTSALESHADRIKGRLRDAKSVDGHPFAFKDESKRGSRPLQNGAKLLDGADFSTSVEAEGAKMSMSIRGRAATITAVQNARYNFLGFSASDREEIAASAMKSLASAFKRR